MTTFQQKLAISIGSTALFALINIPQTYKLINSLIDLDLYNESTHCPTNIGLILHAIIFFILTFLSMGDPTKRTGTKLKHSIYGTLIFFFISSPMLYSTLNLTIGSQVADVNGCPTMMGIGLTSLIYFISLIAIMYLP